MEKGLKVKPNDTASPTYEVGVGDSRIERFPHLAAVREKARMRVSPFRGWIQPSALADSGGTRLGLL
jgi:hypothetical protein